MAGVTDLAPPRRRSYSQLDVYQGCPRLYHHKYVERAPELPSWWTLGGTSFHTCAEWYLTGRPGFDTLDGIRDHWRSAWELAYTEAAERNPLVLTTPPAKWRGANRGAEDELWWQSQGPRMVERLVEFWTTRAGGLQVLHDDQGPMIERRISTTLGGVEVIAIPDLVVVDEHGQVNVVDWKSGKPPKGNLQLHVYRTAIQEEHGYEAAWGLYYMSRAGQFLPTALDRWTHQEIGAMFADFDLRERSGDYTPTPGDACRFCPIKKTCPAQAKEKRP